MEYLTRKERERLQNRNEIMKAAEIIFSENGYHKTTIQEIADAAEFSIGTIYNFFGSKEDIYLDILKYRFNEYMDNVEKVLDSANNPLKKIIEILSVKIKFFEEHKCFFQLYFQSTMGNEWNIRARIDKAILTRYDEYMKDIELIFGEAVERGKIKQIDPGNLAISFEGLTNAFILHWARMKKESSLQQFVTQIEEIFFERILL